MLWHSTVLDISVFLNTNALCRQYISIDTAPLWYKYICTNRKLVTYRTREQQQPTQLYTYRWKLGERASVRWSWGCSIKQEVLTQSFFICAQIVSKPCGIKLTISTLNLLFTLEIVYNSMWMLHKEILIYIQLNFNTVYLETLISWIQWISRSDL